jgi:hypothetical protein
MEFGSHEVQKIVTITLLVATGMLALLCDYIRFRMHRPKAAAMAKPATLKTAIGHTLVPEITVPAAVAKPTRASRLAAALQQPKRTVSPIVQAIIARNTQLNRAEPVPEKKPAASQKKAKAQRAG